LEGFPQPPEIGDFKAPFVIKSAFRPYGVGRRSVRPVLPGSGTASKNKKETAGYKKETAWDGEGPYKTEVLELREEAGNRYTLRLRLLRGFRHQIRCHLSWIGFPILADPLYGGLTYGPGTLALRADFLSFADPETGELREYRLTPA
jgi:23S rRNA pseudouridine1911/1915/1917 synthase